MRLCKNPTYVSFAYTAGLLSSFGRNDPDWRGTPPYQPPSTREPAAIGQYPPPDENALAGLLRQKRVAKTDPEATKETKRKGAQARKEYKPAQRSAVRRKRALRSQSLKLSEPLVDIGLTEEAATRGSKISKRTILRKAIQEISSAPSREVLNNVNTVDRYERWQRGQLTPAEIKDINAGKISLPSKQERDTAHSFLTKTENVPTGIGDTTISSQANKTRAQGIGGRTKEIQQIMQEAEPVQDVLSGKSRKTNVPSGEGSIAPLVKQTVEERNAREAARLADPALTFDNDIAIARGVDPRVSTAPTYVAPSSRDPSSPTGIKEGKPLTVQYTPKTKGKGLQTRRDKLKRVLANLDGQNEYGALDLSRKAQQDVQLLGSQLKPERIRQVAGQKVNEATQALDSFITPNAPVAPAFTSTMEGTRTTPLFPDPAAATTATATQAPPTAVPAPGQKAIAASKTKVKRTATKATTGNKGFTINIQMPDGQTQAVPSVNGRSVDVSALPNVGKKGKEVAATAETTGKAVTDATRGGLVQRIRSISPSQSKLLKGGAALAGAGGILLGGNALANAFSKKSTPIPPMASYPSSPYGY